MLITSRDMTGFLNFRLTLGSFNFVFGSKIK